MSNQADIRANEPMLDWTPTAQDGGVVKTERGTYLAGRLVIASGDWIADAVPTPAADGTFYGFSLCEHPGLKLGGPHLGREPMDPRDDGLTPGPRQVALIRDRLARHLPDAAGDPPTLKGCVDSVTPDENFIIDAVPGVPQRCSPRAVRSTVSNSPARSGKSWPISQPLASHAWT